MGKNFTKIFLNSLFSEIMLVGLVVAYQVTYAEKGYYLGWAIFFIVVIWHLVVWSNLLDTAIRKDAEISEQNND